MTLARTGGHLFHTSALLKRLQDEPPTHSPRRYATNVSDSFEEDFAGYILFLACLMELSRPWRLRALAFLTLELLAFVVSICRISLA